MEVIAKLKQSYHFFGPPCLNNWKYAWSFSTECRDRRNICESYKTFILNKNEIKLTATEADNLKNVNKCTIKDSWEKWCQYDRY